MLPDVYTEGRARVRAEGGVLFARSSVSSKTPSSLTQPSFLTARLGMIGRK
jgi:hypothetical protein